MGLSSGDLNSHWSQQVAVKSSSPAKRQEAEVPPAPLQLRCPRCYSGNTKFCYYNNYSKLQPRYFCRGCRRHWTAGGTLRNVPIGGGGRKAKRPRTSNGSPSSSSSAGATAAISDSASSISSDVLRLAPPLLPDYGRLSPLLSIPPPHPIISSATESSLMTSGVGDAFSFPSFMAKEEEQGIAAAAVAAWQMALPPTAPTPVRGSGYWSCWEDFTGAPDLEFPAPPEPDLP